jgi:shikimate dehydrogenase
VSSQVPDRPGSGRRAAVLGHPVAHSLSPVLHRAAYSALGLTGWTYQAIDVDEPELAPFLARAVQAARGTRSDPSHLSDLSDPSDPDGGWVGWSLTMPLKRAVRPLLVRESDLAREVGAVNTVLVCADGLAGFNTDVHGIVEAFGECGVRGARGAVDPAPGRRGAVLGGGATAASAIAALKQLGCREPVVHVRSPGRAGDLLAAAERLGVAPVLAPFDADAIATSVSTADLVISTLPGRVADALVRDGVAEAARVRAPVLLDVVYTPWPTALASAWTAQGAQAVGGFVMLVHQACSQVHLMTGRQPPIEEMRSAGEAALHARTPAPTTSP